MNVYKKIGYLLKCARVARQLSTVLNKNRNFYEMLGVNPTATAAEIKNAYFEKTKLYHPDVGASTEESLTLFRQISEAYEVLGSPTLRKQYDKEVLGILSEDDQDSEDPISLYKKQMSDKKMYSWTKEHYTTLRRQQSMHNYPIHKEVKIKSGSENQIMKYGPTLVLSIMLIVAASVDFSQLFN